MVSSERQGKPAALALLASMAIVAMTLWAWPSPSPQIRHTPHSDAALPASVPVLLPVPALPPAPREHRQAAVRVEVRAPEMRPKVQATPAPAPPALTLEPPDLAAIGADTSSPAPVLIASHAVVLPMRPLVAAAPRSAAMPVDSNGNPFAHAGLAIGSAFRRAGVNAGAAFSRIF